MIWYDEIISVEGCPEGTEIQLVGCYKDPIHRHNKVAIVVLINTNDGSSKYTIKGYDPASMAFEEPTADEVLQKYHHQIKKFSRIVHGKDYKSLLIWLKA